MIIELFGPSCSGKSQQTRKLLEDHEDYVEGCPVNLFFSIFGFVLPLKSYLLHKTVLSLLGFLNFFPICKSQLPFFKFIKIYYNICYKLSILKYYIKIDKSKYIYVIDEGPRHMPYGLYQCKLININHYIAFKTRIYKPIHITSNQKTLLQRIKKRGHWRIKKKNFNEFISYNLKIQNTLLCLKT